MDRDTTRPLGTIRIRTGEPPGTEVPTGTAPPGQVGGHDDGDGAARPTDVVRQAAVLGGSLLATAAAAVGGGAFGGQPVAEAAGGALSASATHLAPGGPAFTIWSVVYAGHLALAVRQALPGQRADVRQREVGWLVVASLVLNAAWLGAVQLEQLGLSVAVIAVLLGVLVVEMLRLVRRGPRSLVEAVVVDVPVGLYLGWVAVATVANVAAVLADAGLTDPPGGADLWAGVVVGAVALVGAGLGVATRGRLAVAAATAWGLAWVAVARASGEPRSPSTAVVAGVGAAVVLGVTGAVRLRERRRRGRPRREHAAPDPGGA